LAGVDVLAELPEVSVVRDGLQMTIVGKGLLDLSNSGEFAHELKSALDTAEQVVVDLRYAVFIDTAVVQYLASAIVKLRQRDKRLQVRVMENSHPERVIQVLGFDQLMDIEVETA
jgi:anti-anti-sigma regulatory factor